MTTVTEYARLRSPSKTYSEHREGLDFLLLRSSKAVTHMPLLGFGSGDILRIDRSTVPNAGHGLFSNRHFMPGDAISLYDGIVLDKINFTPAHKHKAGTSQHACKIKGTEYVVLGFQFAFSGRGLGSFANHSTQNNARIATKSYSVRYLNHHCCPFLRRCLVAEAILPISPGDEIFVKYSKTTLVRLNIADQ